MKKKLIILMVCILSLLLSIFVVSDVIISNKPTFQIVTSGDKEWKLINDDSNIETRYDFKSNTIFIDSINYDEYHKFRGWKRKQQ